MLEGGVRTLIAAAYPPELAGLATLLPAAMARGRVMTRAIGVGLVDAAVGAQAALGELLPERAFLVGTAGALPGSGLAIGSVVVAARARLVVRPFEYAPAIMATEAAADEALAESAATALAVPRVTVACPVGITASDEEAARIGREAEVEQLECFAWLRAARAAGVPAIAILAIANEVGAAAAAQWKAHRHAAEAAAQQALARLVDGRDG
jgi:futalosine hydrolase